MRVVDGSGEGLYSTGQWKGKHFPRAICGRPASYPQSNVFLAVGTMRATHAHACTRKQVRGRWQSTLLQSVCTRPFSSSWERPGDEATLPPPGCKKLVIQDLGGGLGGLHGSGEHTPLNFGKFIRRSEEIYILTQKARRGLVKIV